MQSRQWGILIFGLTEIIIGSFTLAAVLLSLYLGKSTKPVQVLLFVLLTSVLSACLGIGLLRRNLASLHTLLFFASVIILSKILIFLKIITLNGALETSIPQPVKNAASIIYHTLLIWYFSRPALRQQFGERRNVLFSVKLPFCK